ncbi:MAG TPA: carbonic anhydrase [Denitromonas sp.]|uniref:carbonic anhydrase n=1 Tax=Denitromonas sp. TaxID=2734609 RepID=UPI001D93EE1B|nr:carbonic anhydrase [Rhodocyclaceae bacterium]MCP5221961.1 carbonic anhydrase [Zoogloeaceae bacterium]HPR06713.1 carbonic anhydrase [Denitromonas sp.]HQU89465.1 carbonic anhydrase [Denitromonas sp.]HQV15655.1 carbonic anhydrase [Denitromonas sp.]
MINDLLQGNRRFVETVFERERPYFAELSKAQHPTVLWIGCSDSRVPVNTITQTRPGEIFVHRNVANIVAGADWNLSAVLEFSINHLNIPDIVICGHYGCGGILALDNASEHDQYVPIWLNSAREAAHRVDGRLLTGREPLGAVQRHRLIVEENVSLQMEHLLAYPFVARAVDAGNLAVHGWVYDMDTGGISVQASRPRHPK